MVKKISKILLIIFLKDKKDSILITDNTDFDDIKDRTFINKSKDMDTITTTSYGKIIIYKKLQDIDTLKTELKEKYPDIKIETYNNPIPNEILDQEFSYKS